MPRLFVFAEGFLQGVDKKKRSHRHRRNVPIADLHEKLKKRGGVGAAAIATAGEVFTDGNTVELVSGVDGYSPQLMLFKGTHQTVGPFVECQGRRYEPTRLSSELLRELILPMGCHPHGSTPELLAGVCTTLENLVGLSEKFVSLIGRFVLSTWLVGALPLVPALAIAGPDVARAERLLAVLHSLCRHAVRITNVTPSRLCSLPSGLQFTFIISQPTVSEKLVLLLHDISRRDARIPLRGRILDLYGAQVLHTESLPDARYSSVRSVQIPMVLGGKELPSFDSEGRRRLAADFQPKLLSFRRANLDAAEKMQFDASKFALPIRELAHSIAAATPDDAELRADVFRLLQDEDAEARDRRWVHFSNVAAEAILVAYRKSPGDFVYVSEMAESAAAILRGRGEDDEVRVDPSALGKWLRQNGFRPEPRDARGSKLRLTEGVFRQAQNVAREFGAPALDSDSVAPAS